MRIGTSVLAIIAGISFVLVGFALAQVSGLPVAAPPTAATAPAGAPVFPPDVFTPGKYADPVPHELITEPYRVCQDLEELTARINNLHRKPFHKLIDARAVMQPELVFFKDVTSGHEVMSLTRELCSDMSHGDLGRPCWTADGRLILFMGNRGHLDAEGKFRKSEWSGWKFLMNADYSLQRPLMVAYKDECRDKDGKLVTRSSGIYSKFNIMDPNDPRYAYYAVNDKLWRVTLSADPAVDSVGELLCTFVTPHTKIIQDISTDGRYLLVQDANADLDRTTRKPLYMPQIHLIDLAKKPGEKEHYQHHPFDYGLPEVKAPDGKVLHAADNNYQFHSLSFGKTGRTIAWNYGPMTSTGEYLGWTLDVTDGLDGTPKHGQITSGGGANPFGQYESHGKLIGGGSTKGLYFSGQIKGADGKPVGGWGIWIRDYADDAKPPQFLLTAPGGHVAGGNSRNADVWAAHVATSWRDRVKESDCIVWGEVSKANAVVLCNTYSDVRGGIQRDRKTNKPLKWSGMDNNDFRPYSSIPRPLLSPDATKLWFHSCVLQPTEDYVGIYVAVTKRPQAPPGLELAAGAKDATLTWKHPKIGYEAKAFHVYRGDASGANFAEIAAVPAESQITFRPAEKTYTYTDRTAQAGQTYTYAVTTEEWSTLESDETSNTLVVALATGGATAKAGPPARDFDKTAPPAVEGFTVAKEADEDGQFRLRWTAGPAGDLRHYNVYFSSAGRPEAIQKRRIVSPLAGMTEYLDWTAPLNAKAVYYAITAVDRQGNESAPAFAEWTAK